MNSIYFEQLYWRMMLIDIFRGVSPGFLLIELPGDHL